MSSKTFIILSIIFALIIGSTLQITIVNAEDTENESNREKELAENLISIYEDTRERALEILENQSLPEEVIEEINNAIAQGDALMEQVREQIRLGNYTQAIELAKQAINSLGNVIRKHLRFRERIRERLEEQAAKGLLIAIERHRTMIERLEELLVKFEEKGFSIDNATIILEEAKALLDEAEVLVNEGNVTGAAHKMAESRKLIGKAMSSVKKCAHEKLMQKVRNETLRMIKNIEKEIERVEKHISKLGKLKEKIPPKATNKTKIDERLQGMINRLEQLKQKLSDILEKGSENAIEGMKNIKGLHGKFKNIQEEINETEEEIEIEED
ncbi:MAG: hypothetical protein QXR03_04700 [Candidatus Aenigmatarchaeota archaeon]